MPPKKKKTQERDKEAAKGSPFMLRWLQSKPAEMSSPAKEPVSQTAGASQTTPIPGRVKEENDSTSIGPHSHSFRAKLPNTRFYTIDCGQPCTVLEAIQSNEELKKKIKCADENLIIQLGNEDKDCIVATHFPCSCIRDGESVIIYSDKEVIEAQDQLPNLIDKTLYPKDKYVVFYIDREGGVHSKTKILFKNDRVKKFKYLCVYGKKGMTVEEALKRDGRLIDDLGNFNLSNNENSDITVRTQKVDHLDQKRFKVCLPLCKSEKHEKLQQNPSSNSQSERETTPVSDVVQQSVISVKTALDKAGSSVNTEEIYERLREQFPELKEWMESRFPGDSYQEALNLSRENFGKIEQSFSEVHTIRKMLQLGKSVCRLSVGKHAGTGFVLFDSFILTNAHLFKHYVEGQKLQEGVKVEALFGYHVLGANTNASSFTAKETFVDFDDKLDYAILELNRHGQRLNNKKNKVKFPQGLLKTFCPQPPNGVACIIGHPGGGVKKMDTICIIEKEKRGQAVDDSLQLYKDNPFMLLPVFQLMKDQGIDDIMIGGCLEGVVTYNTFMYHGSSGSPVFDDLGRVFGLHTAGYTYGFPKEKSVIEFARPVLAIFKRFVDNLRQSQNISLLKRVQELAEEIPNLKNILTQEPDSSTPMEVD